MFIGYVWLNNEIYTDDDYLGTKDCNNKWVDVSSLTRPIMLMPVPQKGKTSVISDGAITLWLPSRIPSRLCSSSCVDGLAAKEIVLWVADCSDTLHNIRRCLRELSAFCFQKRKNVDGPGQRMQTRALETLKALRDKRDRHVARYRRSRAAWLALDPDQIFEGGKWKKVLRTLKKDDLAYPGDDEADSVFNSDDGSEDEATSSAVHTQHSANGTGTERRRGEGYKRLTWIWRVQMQDARDIPGLDSTASEEDVYKRKTKNP